MMMSQKRASTTMLLIFVIAFVSKCKGEGYPPAPNCARYECPTYTVSHSEKDFEIRSYEDALWISARAVRSKSFKPAAYKGFLVLFSYIKGINKGNVTIDLTTPVLVDVENSAYTVDFYVPKKFQSGGLPKPLLPGSVTQIRLPKYKYAAVRRFDGFISDENIPTQVAALKKSLRGTPYYGRAASQNKFTLAGYNAPFELTNRVNEVFLWFD